MSNGVNTRLNQIIIQPNELEKFINNGNEKDRSKNE